MPASLRYALQVRVVRLYRRGFFQRTTILPEMISGEILYIWLRPSRVALREMQANSRLRKGSG